MPTSPDRGVASFGLCTQTNINKTYEHTPIGADFSSYGKEQTPFLPSPLLPTLNYMLP